MKAKQLFRLLPTMLALAGTALAVFPLAGCRGTPHLVVGAKDTTEQLILGEILAQHLEHRLGTKVDRRFGIGSSAAAFQTEQGGEISLYPEYTGAIVTEVLKEQPGPDAAQILERARGEMRRVALLELLPPLGFDNSVVMVMRANDPRAAKVNTLDDAAAVKDGWKIGVSYEFQQRSDGISLLTSYQLPMVAAVRGMDRSLLFPAMQRGDLTMIAARGTDGVLASPDWKILTDSRHLFTPQQACVLVRQDALTKEPRLKAALDELSGKFTTEQMRKLNAQVDVNRRQPADVAAGFLASAGLQ